MNYVEKSTPKFMEIGKFERKLRSIRAKVYRFKQNPFRVRKFHPWVAIVRPNGIWDQATGIQVREF